MFTTDVALYMPVDGLHELFHGFNVTGVLLKAGVRRVEVPEEFWFKDREGDKLSAVVSCRCGSSPRIEQAAAPSKCGGCGRWFFFDGTRVLALNSPIGDAA